MEYTQRENLINHLRDAVMGDQIQVQEIDDKHFDAGTGTLYMYGNNYNLDNARKAIQYFKKKIDRKNGSITPKNIQEKAYCELAISCIQKRFGI